MNYSSQVWQYMAMAQDGSSRLPMDLQLVGHSHATCPIQGLQPPFRGRENMVPPPQMPTFFVGNICGESVHENKKIWYVL